MKNIFIFDLDGTVINSEHRTPNFSDGTLNTEKYFATKTHETVMQDELFPLAKIWQQVYNQGHYVWVLTARHMNSSDLIFLSRHNLKYHLLLSRDKLVGEKHKYLQEFPKQLWEAIKNNQLIYHSMGNKSDADYKWYMIKKYLNLKQFKGIPKYYYEDAPKTITKFRQLFPTFNAKTINRRLLNV